VEYAFSIKLKLIVRGRSLQDSADKKSKFYIEEQLALNISRSSFPGGRGKVRQTGKLIVS
jgi:hypothetical protein